MVNYNGRIVELDKPFRSVKGVYVLKPNTGRVNLIRFGDKGMRLNKQFSKRRKTYCARSKGIKSSKPSKLSPNYWSRKRWLCK